MPGIENYDDALNFMAKNNPQLPKTDTIRIYGDDDLMVWAFERMLQDKQVISSCPVCHKYFVSQHGNQTYCSQECYHAQNATGKFCDDKEIAELYQKISSLFQARRRSDSPYTYECCGFIGSFDERELLRALQSKRDDPRSELFNSQDFEKMYNTYHRLFKKRYGSFKKSYQARNNGADQMSLYQSERESFVCWLKNIHTELLGFQKE